MAAKRAKLATVPAQQSTPKQIEQATLTESIATSGEQEEKYAFKALSSTRADVIGQISSYLRHFTKNAGLADALLLRDVLMDFEAEGGGDQEPALPGIFARALGIEL